MSKKVKKNIKDLSNTYLKEPLVIRKKTNEIKADASEIPPGTEWKTLENGEHILVNEHGTIISGAGGNLKGKYFKNKDTGKFEKYTFNQQTLAKEAEREYNENKQKELEAQNKEQNSNINKEIRDISKAEYTQNRKDLKNAYDMLGFNQRELDSIHPNDKKNRAIKQKEVDYWKENIDRMEAENKKYEETKKKVNKGDKESKGQTSKEKKIGKTYSIAYDNDTIEKLKSLGKTWQDKRIYFKELNNSYYDLVSEKWVTDSPETTKKAIEMASESIKDRETRLANEQKEAEEKKKREYEEKEAREKPLRNNVANKIKNKEEFSKQVIEKIKEHGYNSIDKGSVNKIANELFTEDELNAWKNANPYSSEIKDVLKQGDYQYNTYDEIDITPKSLIYDIMKNHFYAKKQNDKPLSFEDFLEITNDTILDMHSKSEAWEMYGNEYRDYLREHKKRLKQ